MELNFICAKFSFAQNRSENGTYTQKVLFIAPHTHNTMLTPVWKGVFRAMKPSY